ncbi:NAD(P)-dependent oxidoreductase [Streptomyces sp. KL116D]|uniref:NAD(P)-dependent oxidoreductase n=1 Tax=Streptomyces sp. KL116D TaxID=3045152 RepID=UPI00355645EF
MTLGAVVGTDALLKEVHGGRLRAALDVTDPEPLPPGHPLWTTPGVLITPHVGAFTPICGPVSKRSCDGSWPGSPQVRSWKNVVTR